MPTLVTVAAVAVFVNGHQVMLPTSALQIEGTVLVPVKGVFDRLGAKIAWNEETREVRVTAPDVDLVLTVGDMAASLNGSAIQLRAAPELRDGHTLVPLRLVATALGADIAWDQQRRRVYVEAGPRGPAAGASIGELVAAPYDWAGRMVIVTGEYRGREPSPFGQATRNGTPVSRRDWVLRDDGGEIYCRGDITVESPLPLTPYSNIGARLTVTGVAKLSRQGFVFLEPRGIVQAAGTEGLICTVDTGRRSYLQGETVRIRLKVANPLATAMSFPSRPGVEHDVSFLDSEGEAVWRLSEASPPALAPATVELQPGEEFTVQEIWTPGTAHCPQLPAGRYDVVAEYGGVLTSYPHTFAILPRDD